MLTYPFPLWYGQNTEEEQDSQLAALSYKKMYDYIYHYHFSVTSAKVKKKK